MAKKRREQQVRAQVPAQVQRGITKRGWMVMGAGAGVVAAGFYILSLVDRDGRNWAGTVSPALILAGYLTMGWGIIVPQPVRAES